MCQQSAKETVVIIGAGILGLASAIQLQSTLKERGYDYLIVARDWPSDESINYTSPWAGAHGRPLPSDTPSGLQHEKFAQITDQVLEAQARADPSCGVEFMDGYDFMARPSEAYTSIKGVYGSAQGFRLLSEHEFPADMDIRFGAKYRTWSLNSPVYCAYLLRKFRLAGGRTLARTLLAADEAFSLVPNVRTVVNCSGYGFGDPAVYPTRGQTCLVANPCDRTITQVNADGTWTFIIPRPCGGGTIVGGTKEPHDWETSPRPETREHLLKMVAKMYPPILGESGKFDVIRDIVGRRPTRDGGLRLEVEHVTKTPGLKAAGARIVHAYGAGGSGYSLSWGVAHEVVRMVAATAAKPAFEKALL